jgi:hypothetical protein
VFRIFQQLKGQDDAASKEDLKKEFLSLITASTALLFQKITFRRGMFQYKNDEMMKSKNCL